jgi:hypothetical protein
MKILTKKPTAEEIRARIQFLQLNQDRTKAELPNNTGNCHGITVYLLGYHNDFYPNKNYVSPLEMEEFLGENTSQALVPVFGDVASLWSCGRILHTGIYLELDKIFNKMDCDMGWREISMSQYESYVRQRYSHYLGDGLDWRFHRLK